LSTSLDDNESELVMQHLGRQKIIIVMNFLMGFRSLLDDV